MPVKRKSSRWVGKVPGGKQIDALIRAERSRAAISALQGAERELISRRDQIGNIVVRLPNGSNSRKRYLSQVKKINSSISKIRSFLYG